MKDSYFQAFDAQQKQSIQEKTDTIAQALEKWAPRYPFVRATRIPTSALLTATVVPNAPLVDAMTVAQMILWVFGVDDEIDEHMITFEEMQQKADRWYTLALEGPAGKGVPEDDLTAILLEMMDNISRSPLFEPLRVYWATRVRLLVESMAKECWYGVQYHSHGKDTLPPLDEYLKGGIQSIGFPLWGAMVLILQRDTSILQQIPAVDRAISHAGAAVRLYNDVRTLERELGEGGINSVVIAYHTILDEHPDLSREQARERAQQEILEQANEYAQRCRDAVERIHTDTRQIEETISRVVAFHSYYYTHGQHDYHITSQADTYHMLNADAS